MSVVEQHWKFIKEFPYWETFKQQTWYFFRPIAHIKDAHKYCKSGDEKDITYSYDKRHNKDTK